MFRSEAIEARKQKLHGDVFLTQPLSFSAITLLLVSVVILAVVLLIGGSYARSEHVSGYLVPSKGLVKIQSSQFGTLEALYAREGDIIREGQLLANILVSPSGRDGRSIAQLSLEALSRQQTALGTQVALEENQLEAELGQLLSEKAETELRIVSLGKQILLQKQITASAAMAYTDVQEILKKGYISKVESERRRQTWLSQQAQEQLKAQELSEVKARLEQLAIRQEQLPNESKQRLSRLQAQQSELDTRQAEFEGRRAYTISSPVNGRVVSIHSSSIGRTVQAGQPLLAIMPEGSTLEAELFVPSRAAGFVEEGQEVRILYDAFPYQRFGSFPAKITQVAGTILAPNEAQAPFDLKEPVYRVTAVMEKNKILARGREIALQSGMTLQANIVLERRSFLDWLLEPLRAVGGRT